MNDKNYDFANIKLDIVTPCCVSTGLKLTSKDYLYDATTSTMYFVNHLKWHKFIIEKNLFTSYATYIANVSDSRNLSTWLQGEGYKLSDVKEAIIASTHAEPTVLKSSSKETLNDVYRCMRLSDGRVYIPGSSIKGFLHSAILHHCIKKDSESATFYWNKLKGCTDGKSSVNIKDISKIQREIETNFLHKLLLKDNRGKVINSQDSLCSVMRGLQVSDALPVNDIQTEMLQKIDFVLKGAEAYDNSLPLFKECVLRGCEFQFSVKIDKSMFSLIGIFDISQLLAICHEYVNFIQNIFECAFAKEFSDLFEVEDANIYIGGNTGFLTKTNVLSLVVNPENAKDFIKMILDSAFRKHKHMLFDKTISPRTLKCTYDGYDDTQMGLAFMSVVK